MAENLMIRTLRTTPAAHLTDLMEAATVSVTVDGERGVSLREIAFAVQIGLRAEPGTASAAALEAIMGVPLPTGHGQSTGDAQGQHVLWLAPDEFLAVDVSRQQVPGDADALAQALDGLPGQAVDLSANRALLELSGPSARWVLEKGCPADLHPRAFAVGTAIVTQLGPVPVILHRSAETEFRLYPRASFADFLVRWLVDSMVEFRQEEVL
ncbi:sarcosine oxidase subunit gamma [Citricoccus alkalitolerans]|uniref:Sarcosine oxidase subunit gamma n=1 Tax=Citricoccus alkalitolerans TaxID=246603 RepID=A0ABV8XY15_9MICC